VSKTSARDALRVQQDKQRRRDRRILALVAVGIVVLLVAGGIGFQAWRTSRGPSGVPSASTSATPVQLVNGQPVVFGSGDAPVRIDLYEDFHCPHCADFEERYASVLTTAQEKGQAAIRFFPLSFVDPGSLSAANGFACAAEAGFGETYYDGLFANPSLEWNNDQLLRLAEQASGAAPSAAFSSCITARRQLPWLESISTAATQAGVQSTPSLLLNGTPVDIVTLTPESLTAQIDAAAKQ
jgi:protein-disulfide isomerase